MARINDIRRTKYVNGLAAPGYGETRMARFHLSAVTEHGQRFEAQAEMYVRFRAFWLSSKGLPRDDGKPAAEYNRGDLVPVKYFPAEVSGSSAQNPVRAWIIDADDPEAQRVLHVVRSRGFI